MKTLRLTFNFLIFNILFFISSTVSLSAYQVSNETFTNTLHGWVDASGGSDVWEENDKMRINRDDTAEKTYSFPYLANQTITFTLNAEEISTWENNDHLEIRVDGTKVIDDTINNTESKTFTATLDGNGEVTIKIKPNTSWNAEDIFIDDIIITTNYIPVATSEYRLDECAWSGAVNEVLDSQGSINGQSFNNAAINTGGKICNSGFFAGVDADYNTFDGDYVSMGNNFDSIFGNSNDAFTITAWIKPNSLGSSQSNHGTRNTFIGKSSDSKNDNLEIGITTGGKLHLYLDTSGNDTYADFGSGITVGSWHFIAVTYDSNDVTVTIDGSSTTDDRWSGNLDQAVGSPFTLAANLHKKTYFNGLIDEVKIYDVALPVVLTNLFYTNEDAGNNYDGTSRTCSSCNDNPIANAGSDQSIRKDDTVTFDGSLSNDPDGSIVSYDWSYNGTTLTTGVNGTYNTATTPAGIYNILLTVTDNIGAIATDTVTITITNTPPVAHAGNDQIINLGESVTLDGSGSSDSDGNITDYSWYEGGVAVGSGSSITLTNLTAGLHTITLTVTDNNNNTHSDTVDVRVNTAPVAHAGPDQNITLGETLHLDGTGSTDDFNSITDYTWIESTIPLTLSGATPTANINTAGTYTITLTVTDNNGLSSTDTLTVLVNTPPVVEDMNFTILRDTSVSFELNATDADGDTIVSYPIFTSPSHGSLSGPESNMTYTPDANYTGTDFFTYKAFDGISHSNLGTVTFNIFPPATAIHDDFNTTYHTLLNGNVLSNDLGLNIELIDFNTTTNGSLSISSNGAFTYLPNELFDGNDTFSYTIKDDFNLTSTTTATILVYPPRSDLSIFKTAPANIDIGQPIDYTLEINSSIGEQYINAKNVRVTDFLPSGVTYSGITAPSGWTCGQVGGVVSCDASDIPLGYNATIVIHAFAANTLGDSINTATISSDTIDPDLSNNTSSATTNITGPDVDLSITKTVSSPTVTITDAFSYTLSVQNSGTADTTGVTITDELDTLLGFISIEDGSDWTCSQGSSINCSYIANGGVFVAGGSSNDIRINVRAPSVEANITNIASVSSNTPELNPGDNNASVDVNITNGTNQTSGVNLTKYLQYNLYGNMKLIGNANINKLPGDPDKNYNDNINMHYVDTDGSANTTFNSSSSTLTLTDPREPTRNDLNRTIIWAGLYWEGHVCSTNSDGTGDGSGTGCNWENSSFSSLNDASGSLGSIQLKTPNRAGYIDITANTLNIIQRSSTNWTYSAFTDITNLLDNNETGEYRVANVVLTEGKAGGGGNYGGWSILVIYEDDNKTVPYKNISVFNGFQYISSDNNDLNISGFLTPAHGDINATIAFFAADGDPVAGGVARMRDGTSNTFSAIGSASGTAESPSTNLFNSTIGEFGIPINTGVTKTYGVDADHIDVSDHMTNNQTDTQFKLDVSTPSGGVDHYSISLFSFATDLTTPLIDRFSKSAYIIDKDGTRREAGPNQPIYPGSSLEYTISFKNIGDEVAEGVVIFDDFDFDGLSEALNINHFDTSKLKLFDGNNTTNEIANPDCGYDISDRRVYCNLSTVAIGASFTMQFVVSVKESLDISIFDKNASNTAYAKYRNPNGDTYVKLYTTPDGEPVGGKSNALNSGVFSAIDRGDEDYISIDAINAGYVYANDKNITTKIVNSAFKIQLIHRDKNLANTAYQAWENTKPMAVLVTLEGDGTPTTPLAIGTFYEGTFSTTLSGLTLTHAHSNDRFKMAYLDWNTILAWAPSTSACRVNTDQSVNLNGLPACFNSYDYVEDIFPRASFREIATCYGEGTPAGRTYPCDPLAYRTGGDLANANIYPDAYNHNFGCYQCITQGFIHFRKDSTDNFAARPDHFEFNSNDQSFPDLLRSAQDYNLSLIAKDGLDNATLDYNTTGNTFRMAAPTLNPNNDSSIDTASLEGDANITASVATIRDGVSVDSSGNAVDGLGRPIDNIGFTFNNVGEVGINIIDPAWANVDIDDTPEDCNTTTNTYGVPIEAGRDICAEELITRFIPHHFILTSQLKNHRDGTFTYMHTNDYAAGIPHMAAHVSLAIKAENKKGNITTNFKKNAYEHPITVDLNVTDWNTTLKNIRNLENPRLDINRNKKEITNVLLGFGTNGYSDGTYTIETNSSTLYTQQLMFNYNRVQNVPKDPFIITGSEVNSTIISTYTSTKASEGTALIKGTDAADGNATFYYARVRPAKDFYPNVAAAQQNTPVLIDVYCDISADLNYTRCNRTAIGIDTTSGYFSGNELKWWLALKHNQASTDGNVTLKVTGTGGLNKTKVIILTANNAEDENITVRPNTVNRPITVRIDLDTTNLTDTNAWIYDPVGIAVPPPFEEVEFIGNSNWTGQGETGNVVGSSSSKKINKRLGW